MSGHHDVLAARRPRAGFTLIELLIVVTIIVVLISMTGVVGPMIQDRIKNTHCQRNLRTTHEILFSYAAQNAGWFPEFNHSYGWSLSHPYKFSDGRPTQDVWEAMSDVAQLKKLGGSAEVFFCPFHPEYGNQNDWQYDSWEHPHAAGDNYTVYLGYYFLINRGGQYGAVNPLSDGRYPIRMDNAGQDDMPIAADLLHYRSVSFVHGWYHGGGPTSDAGLFNSACNTLFFGGQVVWRTWDELDTQGPGAGSGAGDRFYFWLGHETEQ